MTKQTDLLGYVFDNGPHLLSSSLLEWMNSSPRFTSFVETYRDKIRKKLRLARDPESAFDLHGELEVAYCLLNDRRLEVAYELYASKGKRSPDFAITYRANLTFNLEVARIRGEESGAAGIALPRKEERILRILLDKLGQMQPGMGNLLVIRTGDQLARSLDLEGLMREIKTRAEARDPSFYSISRYAGPGDFYRDFLHLSSILLWSAGAPLWVNKQARPALPEKVLRLVQSLPPGAAPA